MTSIQPAKEPFTIELVREVAMDWADDADICMRHNLSTADLQRLREYEPFLKAVAAMKVALDEGRVTSQFKAKIAVEDLIPEMHKIARELDAPHKDRVAVFLALMKLAGLGAAEAPQGQGGGFVVNINVGPRGGPEVKVIEAAATVHDS